VETPVVAKVLITTGSPVLPVAFEGARLLHPTPVVRVLKAPGMRAVLFQGEVQVFDCSRINKRNGEKKNNHEVVERHGTCKKPYWTMGTKRKNLFSNELRRELGVHSWLDFDSLSFRK
jgi:hypothetical protein